MAAKVFNTTSDANAQINSNFYGYPNIVVNVAAGAGPGTFTLVQETEMAIGTQIVFIQTGNYAITINTDANTYLAAFAQKKTTAGFEAVATAIKIGPSYWALAGNLV